MFKNNNKKDISTESSITAQDTLFTSSKTIDTDAILNK